MEFTFKTTYHQKAMTAMAKALRKTVRKKHSRRSHIFGWIVTILALLLVLPFGGREVEFEFQTLITWLAILVIVIALLFEDYLNGFFARKRMLPGARVAVSHFCEEGYLSEVEIGKTEWKYENIEVLAETKDYFVFLFGKNHAQVYEKKSIQGGDVKEFRRFIEEKTGKEIVYVK